VERSWEASWNVRDMVRVCNIRTTNVVGSRLLRVPGDEPSQHMDFGRLGPFVERSMISLPRIVGGRDVPLAELAPQRYGDLQEPPPARVRQLLWAVPGGFFQLMTTVDVDASISGVVSLLEDLYYDEFAKPAGVLAYWRRLLGDDRSLGRSNSPEAHQLVFFPSTWELAWDDVQRVVYRADMKALQQHSAIVFPDELNRRPGRGGALTPFVSTLWGQQDYIENCAIVSAVQLVSAWARVRHIRDVTYDQFARVQDFILSQPDGLTTPARRSDVRQILVSAAELISELEARLTFGVESIQSVMPLIPSLRVEAFHRSLYDALDLPCQSDIAGSMLARLTSAVQSETAALRSVEEHLVELRRRRWAISIGFLTTVAVPLTILLAFFSSGTSDVNSDSSLFDYRTYGVFYAVTFGIVALSLLVHFGLLFRSRSQAPLSRHGRRMVAGLRNVDSDSGIPQEREDPI
jgi:hypothetical protein